MDQETQNYLDRRLKAMERRILQSLAPKKEEHWVRVSTIVKLTGWNKERLRRARNEGTVTYKRENGSFLYLLESVPQILILKHENN